MPKYSEYIKVITIPIEAKIKETNNAHLITQRFKYLNWKKYNATSPKETICKPRVAVPTKKLKKMSDIYMHTII